MYRLLDYTLNSNDYLQVHLLCECIVAIYLIMCDQLLLTKKTKWKRLSTNLKLHEINSQKIMRHE